MACSFYVASVTSAKLNDEAAMAENSDDIFGLKIFEEGYE